MLITGGGTGGHIYPALAIARGLKEQIPDLDILYVGTRQGLETDLVPKEGLPFRAINAAGLERRITLHNVKALALSALGVGQAWAILRKYNPQVVVGTGGFVSGPVMLVASLMKIPTVLHEQNALPGLTNRALSRRVSRVCYTFAESKKYFLRSTLATHTGLPVRPEIIRTDREEGRRNYCLSTGEQLVLVVGGSRGAQSINKAMQAVWKAYHGNRAVHILHVAGAAGYEAAVGAARNTGLKLDNNGNITIIPYLYNMEYALAAADVVIGRAGAAFLAEIMVKGIPAILIPYPYAAENHQEYNARALENKGAAVVICDRELNGENLLSTLQDLLGDQNRLRQMHEKSKAMGQSKALDDILKVILEVSGRDKQGRP
ncbi:MAG: undecaprenyldiphospho-muramoylpentapeptide beta-N-acetylglucosaminyltransferase [Bacillota bacterium]